MFHFCRSINLKKEEKADRNDSKKSEGKDGGGENDGKEVTGEQKTGSQTIHVLSDQVIEASAKLL